MQLKIPILTAIIVMTSILAIPLATHPAAAVTGPPVDSNQNVWAPYGGYAAGQSNLPNRVQLVYYADPSSEFNDFVGGKIDVTDWPQDKANFNIPPYSGPDVYLTPTQGQFGDFGIYFNAQDSVFTATGSYGNPATDQNQGPYWGCDWNQGTAGTSSRITYKSVIVNGIDCGQEMRQGLLHLLDRPAYTRDGLGGTAQALADPSPPAKNPSASSTSEQCSWDTLGTTFMGHTCFAAFNYADDPGGFAAPGSVDFCAAAQHMIKAGIANGMNSDCTLTGHIIVPGGISTLTNHPMRGMIRNNDSRRLNMGNGFMTAINQLFGAAVVVPTYGTIQTLGPIVFDEYPEGSTSDWSFYTFGYGLGGPFPDHMYDLYSTEDASDLCGGPNNPEPDNPTFVCLGAIQTGSPTCAFPPTTCTFEDDVVAASQTASIPAFTAATLAAFHEYGKQAVDAATYSIGIRIAALRDVSGLVNLRGTSYPNGFTVFNGHKKLAGDPTDPTWTGPSTSLYSFGGNDPSTLRWGQSQGVTQLNIFHVSTVWEFQTVGNIYDTLFTASPVQLTNIFCWMCNVDTQNKLNGPTATVDTAGNAHFSIELKNNLYWQDGVKLDASDVAFSLLALRDYAPTAGGGLHFLKGVTVFNSRALDIVFNGNSISFPVDLEAFIIPRHVWECTTDGTCAASAHPTKHNDYLAAGVLEPSITKRSIGFDPIEHGAFIGSAQFACVALSGPDQGTVGTGCAQNSTGQRFDHQNIPIGGTMLLQSYDFAQNILGTPSGTSNAFYQNMRTVDANWASLSSAWIVCNDNVSGKPRAYVLVSTNCPSGSTAGSAVGANTTPPSDWVQCTDNVTHKVVMFTILSSECPSGTTASAQKAAYWQSGQFNEFKWGDQNHNGEVDITDASNLAVCVGATSQATASASCQAEGPGAYAYWQRNAFESTAGTISTGEVAILQAHFNDNMVAPFAWNGAALENIVPYP